MRSRQQTGNSTPSRPDSRDLTEQGCGVQRQENNRDVNQNQAMGFLGISRPSHEPTSCLPAGVFAGSTTVSAGSRYASFLGLPFRCRTAFNASDPGRAIRRCLATSPLHAFPASKAIPSALPTRTTWTLRRIVYCQSVSQSVTHTPMQSAWRPAHWKTLLSQPDFILASTLVWALRATHHICWQSHSWRIMTSQRDALSCV